ncbi:two-component sensor histidine kinase [Leadbettera azotonutricia ZAS-9]|uniref:Two-component sensor histidine kinase n=2 Tax=Leadbettera azotonutricia TaxID=150829 RepID=F5Y7Y4_LEAAZ|nr:two-component sensor histidine kinase [Leadbettera azotonutricia ZAS-9]
MLGQKSIGLKLLIYNVILLALVSIIIGISYGSSTSYSREYNFIANLYRELSLFYRQMQVSRNDAQNYFYSMTDDKLIDYRNSFNTASKNLDNIMEQVNNPYLWYRFTILRNMMVSCNEQFEKMQFHGGNRPSYAGNYQYLMYLFELTDGTQREYYSYLVNYTEIRQIAIQNLWKRMTLLVTLIVAGIILIALFFSLSSSRWVTRPINSIVSNIQKIKMGEYDLRQVKDSGPEFAVLGEAFDDMASSISSNIQSIETNARLRQQLLEIENENLRINEQLIASELTVLQDQMNPHFLFNTLSMISQIASIENAHQAAELIDITTNLLRYSLDKSNRMSTLHEEIECVRNYFHIQRLRFGDRITFELHDDENIPNTMLPGMLLQPLIENAVLHGVGGMVKGALVTVSITRKNEFLFLSVEDNGRGISAEKLEELLNDDSYPSKDSNSRIHIGIINAKKRLEILFGRSARFHVESTEDVGTLITISIICFETETGAGGGFV